MENETPQPAAAPSAAPPPAPEAPRGPVVTDVQAREGCLAVLEVLNGCAPSKILELVERLSVGKMILREIVAGRLVIGNAPKG